MRFLNDQTGQPASSTGGYANMVFKSEMLYIYMFIDKYDIYINSMMILADEFWLADGTFLDGTFTFTVRMLFL